MKESLKVVATIEARMGSSRLPGKVLLPVFGKPMLFYLIERLRSVTSIDEIVLATTTKSSDDVLEEFSLKAEVNCFRGSETNVMSRVIGAGASVQGDIIVQITGDCPIIDPRLVEQTIKMFMVNNTAYVSNAHIRSYPVGMDVGVFRLNTLKESAALTNDPLDCEHVSLHIRNNPHLFPAIYLVAPPDLYWPELGLTLDEENDYVLLKNIINHFGENNYMFSCLDVIQLLKANPAWVDINRLVKRKGDA